MYTEDDLIPLSALQHMHFCPRQCGLIHVERVWVENRFTAEGRVMHKRVHEAGRSTAGGVRTVRSLPLRSLELGLSGVADVVEFHPADAGDPAATGDEPPGGSGCSQPERRSRTRQSESTPPPLVLRTPVAGNRCQPAENVPGLPGRWRVYPVEYKRGRRKRGASDRIQLCAQALCLEEMLECDVPEGSLFHGQTRRRTVVPIDDELRHLTAETARQVHDMLAAGRLPPAEKSAKCKSCSLKEQCLPDLPAGRSARKYLTRMLTEMIES